MNGSKLSEALEKHKLWLEGKPDGVRANFCSVDLRGVNLSYADLSGADLRRANLSCVSLSFTNLSCANLSYTDLGCANLSFTNLSCANLSHADLSYADLRDANLSGASLIGANLNEVCANSKTSFFHLQCPEEGSFIAWGCVRNYIAKLLIPEDAKRISSTSRICKADKAKVLTIENIDGTQSPVTSVTSIFDKNITYVVGEIVDVKNFSNNRWQKYSSGIQFFITRQEAVDYSYCRGIL